MTAAVTDSADQGVSIVAYASIGRQQRAEIDHAVERIFFAASSVQSFRDAAHRDAFRWLWLGRYLEEEPDEAFVAIADGAVCGYLVGSLIDPAPRAADSARDAQCGTRLWSAPVPRQDRALRRPGTRKRRDRQAPRYSPTDREQVA